MTKARLHSLHFAYLERTQSEVFLWDRCGIVLSWATRSYTYEPDITSDQLKISFWKTQTMFCFADGQTSVFQSRWCEEKRTASTTGHFDFIGIKHLLGFNVVYCLVFYSWSRFGLFCEFCLDGHTPKVRFQIIRMSTESKWNSFHFSGSVLERISCNNVCLYQ